MKTKLVWSALSVAAATLIGPGAALAQQCSNTQAQVKAELAEALRSGTIVSGDGTMWRDLGAPRQPADLVAEARTRERVKSELAEALDAGTIVSGDGTLWTDVGAPRQPVDAVAEARTRERVKIELAEALRNGTILSGDGSLWKDLGTAQRDFAAPLLASASCPPSMAKMANASSSVDAGAVKGH